jgi:hypothetical protein
MDTNLHQILGTDIITISIAVEDDGPRIVVMNATKNQSIMVFPADDLINSAVGTDIEVRWSINGTPTTLKGHITKAMLDIAQRQAASPLQKVGSKYQYYVPVGPDYDCVIYPSPEHLVTTWIPSLVHEKNCTAVHLHSPTGELKARFSLDSYLPHPGDTLEYIVHVVGAGPGKRVRSKVVITEEMIDDCNNNLVIPPVEYPTTPAAELVDTIGYCGNDEDPEFRRVLLSDFGILEEDGDISASEARELAEVLQDYYEQINKAREKFNNRHKPNPLLCGHHAATMIEPLRNDICDSCGRSLWSPPGPLSISNYASQWSANKARHYPEYARAVSRLELHRVRQICKIMGLTYAPPRPTTE